MRYQGPRAASFTLSHSRGLRGVSSDDDGLYTCHECGTQWMRRERYAWWPIRLRWSTPSPRPASWNWFAEWGAEIGADAIEQKVFARFVRIGPIVVSFGWKDAYR